MAEKKQVLRIDIKGNEELIKLRQSLQQYQKQLKDLRKEHKDSGTLTKSQATEFANLELNVKKTRSEFNKASKSLKGMNDSTKKGIGFVGKMTTAFTAANLATMAFTKASQVLKNAIQNGVEVFRSYEFAMSKVKAISGATDSEFLKLEQSAQALGRSTFFTATEVGNLQINFSKLGFTASETLDAQEAALLTATATGEDLARTATVIGSTLRGFGLDASEATRVADVMAESFTSSALDIEKFQTAMTKVAPVAKLLGLSLEDTTATLGVLTDSGIEASIAGTSLRNIFLKLGDPSSDLAKSIGFTVNSGEEMVAQFKRMAAEGVNVEKMLKVVDVRQVAAIATMIENVDVLERQIGALENSAGSAKHMSDIVGDNLEGAMRRFNSALDGLFIVLTEQIAPALTNTISFFTKLFGTIADGISPQKTSQQLLMDSRVEFEKQIKVLSNVNISQTARRKVINEINKEFGDYLPNLLSEKSTLEEIKAASDDVIKGMEGRLLAMRFEEEQRAILLRSRVANEGNANKEIAEIRGELMSQQEGLTPQQAEAFRQMEQNMFNMNAGIIENTDQQLKDLEEKYKIMASNIGLVFEDLIRETTTETTTPESSEAGDPEKQIKDATALMDAEMAMRNERQGLLEDYANGEIKTKADLNAKLLEMEIKHLEFVLKENLATGDELIAIEERLLNAKIKVRDAEGDVMGDRIGQMKETGKLLLEIGKAQGENSKITQAGIKITAAATLAETGHAMVKQFKGLSEDVSKGFPTNIIAVASTLALIASFASSFKAFTGGSGGGGGASASGGGDAITFANGGLLQGGMFKGASHANGGVKFAVGGRIMEAEGGEAIINKRSTAAFRPILSAINSYNGNGVKFAEGGLLSTGEKFAMGGELRSIQNIISGGATQRVVLVESDVTSTQNRVSALESRASF